MLQFTCLSRFLGNWNIWNWQNVLYYHNGFWKQAQKLHWNHTTNVIFTICYPRYCWLNFIFLTTIVMLRIILNLIQKASKQNLFHLPSIILKDSAAIWTSNFHFFLIFEVFSGLYFVNRFIYFHKTWYSKCRLMWSQLMLSKSLSPVCLYQNTLKNHRLL